MLQTNYMISLKQIIGIALLTIGISRGQAQTVVSFNFSAGTQPVAGWINVAGEPSAGLVKATDSATGITVSSIGSANWSAYYSHSAFDGQGAPNGTFFPAAVMANEWLQYDGNVSGYNALLPQLQISGLNPNQTYTLLMAGSSTSALSQNPTQYTVAGRTVTSPVAVNNTGNTANGATFNLIAPDTNGIIRVYVNTSGFAQTAGISGIQIIATQIVHNPPVIMITSPTNGDVLAEGGDVVIKTIATEQGGSISKVEFFSDTTKLGQALAPPYNFTWPNPDEGQYVITAKVTDFAGFTSSANINIRVESLSSFWSTTGNIGMNADSNFVGNVDSVRLAFRTKNIERMSISPLGNIGLGILNPTAQLHTTGTVRFAGLTSDSTKNRVLVSDTSGNLFYRNVSSLSSRWQYANGVAYDSSDNIGIGTNNTQGYKLAVNGAGIFTKVRIKPQANWPDFVFNKEYHLPDLTELAQYISQHQHLPGILSATEQLQEGVDVGSHQAALLQKIEELTLYLIQQHKALDEQNRKFEEQQIQLQRQQQEIDELKKLIRSKN